MTTDQTEAAAVAVPLDAPVRPGAEARTMVEDLAHRMAWRYKYSSDPHHSHTYTFNRHCLLAFAEKLIALERERCAKLCDDISDEYQRTEGRRYPELKSDAQEGAATCADRIRAGA